MPDTDTRLREINHRVGSNLQLISSLLHRAEMDIRAGADPDSATDVLRRTQRQVLTIALIQRLIYGKTPENGRLTDFLRTLIDPLKTLQDRPNIELYIDECCVVEPQQVQSVILMLSELIANALRHGFDRESRGIIRVRINRIPPDTLYLLVEDNGKGLRSLPQMRTEGGLGIVHDLAEEHGGHMRWLARDKGAALAITMPFEH